jgi:hypothetical protein
VIFTIFQARNATSLHKQFSFNNELGCDFPITVHRRKDDVCRVCSDSSAKSAAERIPPCFVPAQIGKIHLSLSADRSMPSKVTLCAAVDPVHPAQDKHQRRLPEPDGPITATNSPLFIFTDTPSLDKIILSSPIAI